MRISYRLVRDSGYNTCTRKNVSICPGGASVQKGLTATKKKNYFVTKADLNYETNRKNISFDCSFKKDTEKSLDSAQYDTVQNWLRAVWYCAELRKKLNISGKTTPKTKPLLTHWSVAQAGSNDEKNWKLKILLDCPFKNHQNYMKQRNYKPWHCTWLCIKNCTLL